ncbi:M3 family metallopeptidase [Jonesiaceae bacterium BS-20]|uniref:M3 family metallopeptidase n=1 Tax=Jonesiaceae bacterium BS-20 TaxID=3120821 RepID=A0AAU7E128_9MICO
MSVNPVRLDAHNPFSSRSLLEYELPDFAKIRLEHYLPAIIAGMAQELAEIEQIAAETAPATVTNVLDAFESSGELLNRVLTVLYNQHGADATTEIEDLEEQVAPGLSEHHDAIYMNDRLYARFVALDARITAGEVQSSPAARWLLATTLTDFTRSGITLPKDEREQLRNINARLTTLESAFGRKLLAGANAASVVVDSAEELNGLDDNAIAAAAQAATERGLEGKYLLEMQLPTDQGVLSKLTNRKVRQRVYEASKNRGATGGVNDTRADILEVVKLRAQAAALLGYEHHSAYVAEDSTAKTTAAVNEILHSLAPAAVKNAKREAKDLQAALRADLESPKAKLQPWDWQFYAEQVRRDRYALDDALLRPYLELGNVVHKGIFAAATGLYGITFVERPDLPVYHPDVQTYEVFDRNGSALGLFVADFYTRETKRGGAWMNNLVDQNHLLAQRAIVVNNLNIPKPPAGQPTLLTWDEVITVFHEFGHALHGLFSNVYYPSHSGTNVARDFVEYPSQVNEIWAWDPTILAQYAVHYETGEPIKQEWIETMISSRQFNEGFGTTEYLAAALLDQAWHQLTADQVPTDPDQVQEFERSALKDAGIYLDEIAPRYRTTYYNHIFGGGYSAGYYSYIWSEVLDADTVQWFTENGGLTLANGDKFRKEVLARGGSEDSLGAYEKFRGRPQIIAPLLARRGLV